MGKQKKVSKKKNPENTISPYHKFQEGMVIKTTYTKNVITMQVYTNMQYE